MNWDKLFKSCLRTIDYWGWYVSVRTKLEKEDVKQELLLILWKSYCDRMKRGMEITKFYANTRMRFAAIRIISNHFRDNDTKLGKVPICDDIGFDDIPFYMKSDYVAGEIVRLMSMENIKPKVKEKYMRVLDLYMKNLEPSDMANLLGYSISSIYVIIKEKINPFLLKNGENIKEFLSFR